jgi:aryl-phospho-beta-D-glucosidase BglC (GH1 family)
MKLQEGNLIPDDALDALYEKNKEEFSHYLSRVEGWNWQGLTAWNIATMALQMLHRGYEQSPADLHRLVDQALEIEGRNNY